MLYTNSCGCTFKERFKQNNTVQLLHPPDFFVSFLGEPRGSPGGHLVCLRIRWLRTWLRDSDFRQGPRPRGSVRFWLGDRDRGISRRCWEPQNRGLFSIGLEGRGCDIRTRVFLAVAWRTGAAMPLAGSLSGTRHLSLDASLVPMDLLRSSWKTWSYSFHQQSFVQPPE